MGHSKGSPKREVPGDTGLSKKDRNISNKEPNPTPTRSEEQQQGESRASRRKEITKIGAELKDMETKTKF